MKEKLFAIIAQIMEVPALSITEESSPKNIDSWDSLKHMQLILAVEEAFGVFFTDDEIVDMEDAKSIFNKLL